MVAQIRTPINNRSIQDAVMLWFEDNSSALRKYGHISRWDTSQVTNMEQLFNLRNLYGDEYSNYHFNEDISAWDVSNVVSMGCMFANAEHFNQDISNWDVSKVADMSAMFANAKRFNQNLSRWNIRALWVSDMFHGAESFDQDISTWNLTPFQRDSILGTR